MSITNKSVYLSIAGMDPGWIVGKIAEDIMRILKLIGTQCNYGPPDGYKDEKIVYHLGYAYAEPVISAEVNSLFITHIDDKFKENQILALKDRFDSFVCMATEDKEYLDQLGFDPHKTFGLTLPVRNDYIEPVSLGIFSAHYKDGRKNEKWLMKYISEEKNTELMNLVFVGPGWGSVVNWFDKKDCSFEWHRVSRNMPHEYKFQQNKLKILDYYFYLGFDGGAMGTYDAYAAGIPLLISDQSYHKDIPNVEYFIDNYEKFRLVLNKILLKQQQKLTFFDVNSIEKYVFKLSEIWAGNVDYVEPSYPIHELLKKKRDNYKKIDLRRILSSVKRKILRTHL